MTLGARTFYIAAMVLTGIILALASVRFPVVHEGPVSPLLALVALSLIFDLVIMAGVSRGRFSPLPMEARVVGFFSGALLYLGLRLLLVGQ